MPSMLSQLKKKKNSDKTIFFMFFKYFVFSFISYEITDLTKHFIITYVVVFYI